MTPEFWSGRRVLLTGHTGFKGSWCAALLHRFGARATGFALAPDQKPSLWEMLGPRCRLESRIGDLRDPDSVAAAVEAAKPEIVLHMAAQAQVREGYRRPLETFATNVLGTAQLLEALRGRPALRAVLVVTSDKVYRNLEDGRRFKESDPLGGSDPYSASKAACEMVVRAYAESAFTGIRIATARGGNVVGGGDWSSDRLVPDIVRALQVDQAVTLRNPDASRPWQHVLDCLNGYLTFAERLFAQSVDIEALNFGPPDGAQLSVSEITEAIASKLGRSARWVPRPDPERPEKQSLALDCELAARTMGWRPALSLAETVQWTAEWYGAHAEGADPWALTCRQMDDYLAR